MVVYCAEMLQQSLRHFRPRYMATWNYYASLAAAQGSAKHTRKRKVLALRAGTALSSGVHLLTVIATESFLFMDRGLIKTALCVQQTEQVFFPLHMALWCCRSTLEAVAAEGSTVRPESRSSHVAEPAGSTVRPESRSSHVAEPAVLVWKCLVCGLLQDSKVGVRKHVVECHTDRAGEARVSEEELLLNPGRVARRRRVAARPELCQIWFNEDTPGRGGLSATARHLVADTAMVCAAEMERWVGVFRGLLACAEFPRDPTAGVVSIAVCVRAFYVFLGAQRWRAAKKFWSAFLHIALTGHWRGCSVSIFGPIHDDGLRVPFHDRRAWRNFSNDARRAVQETRAALRDLRHFFQEDVLESHGNHIPANVRDYSTLLFWMPRILEEPQLSERSAFWKGALPFLRCVSAWVANQVNAFEWPDTEQLFQQYAALMCAWWKLSRSADIAARLWAPSRDAGAAARPVFCWKAWWQITHIDRRFRPRGLEGAFAVYHFVGSIGVSEAMAESLCSTLARVGHKGCPRLSLKGILRKQYCAGAQLRSLPRLAKLGHKQRRWGASKWCRFLKR